MAGAPNPRVHTFLIVREPGQPNRILVWDTQDVSVGRAPENDVTLELEELSRRHALFFRMEDAFLVKDLGTSNGTAVNGRPVEVHRLENDDVVQLAEVEIVFRRAARNPATLAAKVEYTSQLKSFHVPGNTGGDPEATILGLGQAIELASDEEFAVQSSDFDLRHLGGGASEPRNLDLEIEAPGADGGSGARPFTLEIEGLPVELRERLAALIGELLELPALRIRRK